MFVFETIEVVVSFQFLDYFICFIVYFAISEEMISDMMRPEFRSYIKDLSSGVYGVDLENKKQSIPTVASFRKLNID